MTENDMLQHARKEWEQPELTGLFRNKVDDDVLLMNYQTNWDGRCTRY